MPDWLLVRSIPNTSSWDMEDKLLGTEEYGDQDDMTCSYAAKFDDIEFGKFKIECDAGALISSGVYYKDVL